MLKMLPFLLVATAQLSDGALLFSKAVETKTSNPIHVDDAKVAIFSVGTDDDVDSLHKIITGYKLAQEVNARTTEPVDWFIAGKFEHPEIFAKNNIKVLDLPVEVHAENLGVNDMGTVHGMAYQHWWSIVPEELMKRGYALSMWFNATEVAAMKTMKIDDARRTLKRANAVMAVSTMDWSTYDKPGTLIHSGLVWFNNSMAKKEHLFNLYKGFVQYEGHKHREEDYLKQFLKQAHDRDFKSATLNPEWQMVCKKSTPQMKDYYAAGNMPYFVHLGNCRGSGNTPPASMQLGLPHQATKKWNDKWSEVIDLIDMKEM